MGKNEFGRGGLHQRLTSYSGSNVEGRKPVARAFHAEWPGEKTGIFGMKRGVAHSGKKS